MKWLEVLLLLMEKLDPNSKWEAVNSKPYFVGV